MKEQEEEEALEPAPEEGEEMPEAEPEMDMDMETEDEAEAAPMPKGASDAEALVMNLLSKIQEFAEENGVSMELEGDEEDADEMDDDEGMMMDAELEGGEDEPADDAEMPEDAEANYGAMQEEIDEDLEAAGVSVVDEEKIVAEVTRRVARRLLRESAKRK